MLYPTELRAQRARRIARVARAPTRIPSAADRVHALGPNRLPVTNPEVPAPPAFRSATAWLVVACLVRWLVAWRTDVPGRDGVTYLWMAEHAARGEIGALFATVFPPVYPALVALVVCALPGLDIVIAGQLVSCAMAALAIVPLFLLCDRLFSRPAAHVAALVYGLGLWFARHPAECMSEGPFFLFAGLVALGLARERWLFCSGLLAGLAYATRPEGAALWLCAVLWLLAKRNLRGALLFAAGGVLTAALVPLGYWALGSGWTLTPKAAFNWDVGAGGAEGSRLAFYLRNAVDLVGAAFEGLGFLTVPLIALGLWVARPRGLTDARLVLLAPFVMQCAVVPLLRANERFVLGYGFLMLGFAGAGCAVLLARLPRSGCVAVLLAVVGRDLVCLPQAWQRERRIERDLGSWLRTQLATGEKLATEMPRLEFFAGQKPGPPRPITAAEILAQARVPDTRFVVVVAARTPMDLGELVQLGFTTAKLPDTLERAALARGISVHSRPRTR